MFDGHTRANCRGHRRNIDSTGGGCFLERTKKTHPGSKRDTVEPHSRQELLFPAGIGSRIAAGQPGLLQPASDHSRRCRYGRAPYPGSNWTPGARDPSLGGKRIEFSIRSLRFTVRWCRRPGPHGKLEPRINWGASFRSLSEKKLRTVSREL